ncbi:MAG TPA: hypothetical protein VNG33_18585 [Polyangiaceae bacterium]|nr:hypothetical protein [Polyangiaceae bacterium]
MTEPLLQFFECDHLSPHFQSVSLPFAALAARIVHTLPGNAERTVALRKLLESKDAAERAAISRELQADSPMPEKVTGPIGIWGPVTLSDCQHPPPNTARNEDPNEGE